MNSFVDHSTPNNEDETRGFKCSFPCTDLSITRYSSLLVNWIPLSRDFKPTEHIPCFHFNNIKHRFTIVSHTEGKLAHPNSRQIRIIKTSCVDSLCRNNNNHTRLSSPAYFIYLYHKHMSPRLTINMAGESVFNRIDAFPNSLIPE